MTRLVRHPNAKEFLARVEVDTNRLLSLPMRSTQRPDRVQGQTAEHDLHTSTHMMSSDIGKKLEPVFGKKDASWPGKYRPSQLYAFLFEGQEILCVAEKGDRGSEWFWVDPNPITQYQGVSCAEDPRIKHFWPDFLVEFSAVIGSPYSDVSHYFSETSRPVSRLREAQLGQDLPSAAPRQSSHRL